MKVTVIDKSILLVLDDCDLEEKWTFVCPHDSTSVGSTEVPYIRNGEYDTHSAPVWVCDYCHEELDLIMEDEWND